MPKIRYVNLSVKNKKLRKSYIKSLEKIFDHGRFILGPEVSLLEKKLSVPKHKFEIFVFKLFNLLVFNFDNLII